ncbi:MAG: ArgE/DapE family deacylase [Thermomicrobiales bacterium]|nr:ArgE/DapE family deacylase [Thermomicrobiales bacterium]
MTEQSSQAMTELAELVATLVRIDSVNPDLQPGAGGEGAIAEFVANWFRSNGIETEIQEAAPGRPNVIGIVRGNGGGRSLMLNAHMDTVGHGGMSDPLAGAIGENKVTGRGAWDMKGSLAAIMLAARDLASKPPRGDVLVTAVVDEEYASIGTAAIVERYTADGAIVTEPTQLELSVAHKGFLWFDITTHGVAAHGSRPDLGIDAIAKMGSVLVGLEQLERQLLERDGHPLLGTGSIHASLIGGGTELSSYPASCTLSIERRLIPGETPEFAEDELCAILNAAAVADPDFEAVLERGLYRAPFEQPWDSTIVDVMRTAARSVLGTEPKIAGEAGWMDSALLSAAGIPTVIFGPDGVGAHADEEWVDLVSLQQCRESYVAAARAFCE